MPQERTVAEPKELSLEAKKQEVIWLLDDVEVAGLADKMDDHLKVAVSDPVRFLYKGERFGLHAFTRLNGYAGVSVTRAVVLDAYEGDLSIPYHPHISSDLVVDINRTITKKDDGDCEEINDPDILNNQIEILRFFKKELPNASCDGEPLKEVPEAVSAAADKLWRSKDMAFERARRRFYEALQPIRDNAKDVKRSKRPNNRNAVIPLRQTPWVLSSLMTSLRMELQYREFDAYTNGDWTTFEEIRVRKESGDDPKGKTLFNAYDLSRGGFNPWGTNIDSVRKVNECIKVLNSMNKSLVEKSRPKKK